MSLSTQSSTKKHVSTPPVLLLTRVVRYNDNSVERGRLAVVSVLAMPIPPLQASLLPAPPFTPLTPPIVLALPPCLLPHQLDAIHDFFICLLAQTDIHGCSTCHERFRGIRMRDAQCDRFSREVCALSTSSFPSPLACSPSHNAAFTVFPQKTWRF
jgi:hypothetical protein